MNNIKFRAWDKKKKIWTNYQIVDDMLYFMDKFTGVWQRDDNGKRFILMQYTGIKLEGEEVYEGDIISDEDCFLAVVEFNNGSFKANNNGYLDEIEEYGDVIGNIYENPELLKGVNND